MKKSELTEALELHKLWLLKSDKGKRAYINSQNLHGVDFYHKDLRCSNFSHSNLRHSVLIGADLRNANFSRTTLRQANLGYANLTDANLRGADLSYANLTGANLTGANLRDASIPIYCKLNHSIKNNKIQIGLEIKTPKQWEKWLDSDEEYDEKYMAKRGTEEFTQIEAVIRAYIAYLKVLKKSKKKCKLS